MNEAISIITTEGAEKFTEDTALAAKVSNLEDNKKV